MDPLFIIGAILGALAISLLFGIVVGRMIAYGSGEDGRAPESAGSPVGRSPSVTSLDLARARRRRDRTPAA